MIYLRTLKSWRRVKLPRKEKNKGKL